VPGWVNCDRKEGPGIDVSADIRDGLPFESESFDYAVAIHALPEVPYGDLVPALEELRRILKPGGVLRVGLPDLEKGVAAYHRGDREYFVIPDEEWDDLGSKLIVQLVWYGYSRTLFVAGFAEELLHKSGFEHVRHVAYRQTASPFREIFELDNRERESLFVEATKL
jgi:SAM-dependent methyltransferase